MVADWVFSQASLQAFLECKRRYYLRYVLKLDWPAHPAEPAGELSAKSDLGRAFHRLVHQHQLGLPLERLEAVARAAGMLGEWNSYLSFPVADLSGARFAELALSAPIAGSRLLAMYDLICLAEDGKATIVDWKTTQARSERWLRARIQTRVYCYVLSQAGSGLNRGRPIRPDELEMVYWFADQPESAVRLRYSEAQRAEDEGFLSELIGEIVGLSADQFTLTEDLSRCRFCAFRSLCDRGDRPGPLHESELEPEPAELGQFDIDLDQIAEFEF